jgi:8-oxo-dGTP diphosphatase
MYQYKYPRPMVCVDVALFELRARDEWGILLIRRGKPPFAGCWALPGGFVERDEDLEAAARRELKEETDVETGELIQVGAFGNPTRDPRGRNISIAYAAVATSPVAPAAGDDASQAAVFPLNALPSLAFDHDELIRSAIDALQLRKKWKKTDVV